MAKTENIGKEFIMAAVSEGICQGKEVIKREEKEKRLRELFNAASDVIEGLEILKNMEGDFQFSVDEKTVDSKNELTIRTNIPVNNRLKGASRLFISVSGENNMAAFGESDISGGQDNIYPDGDKSEVTEKILKYVARHAAKKGLVA